MPAARAYSACRPPHNSFLQNDTTSYTRRHMYLSPGNQSLEHLTHVSSYVILLHFDLCRRGFRQNQPYKHKSAFFGKYLKSFKRDGIRIMERMVYLFALIRGGWRGSAQLFKPYATSRFKPAH